MTNGDVDPRLFRKKPTYTEILNLIEQDADKIELPERIGVQFFDSFAMGAYKDMLQEAAAGTQAVAEHNAMDAAMTQATKFSRIWMRKPIEHTWLAVHALALIIQQIDSVYLKDAGGSPQFATPPPGPLWGNTNVRLTDQQIIILGSRSAGAILNIQVLQGVYVGPLPRIDREA